MKGPTRLIHEDPDFARFVAASDNEEPSVDQVDQALSLASRTAAASRWGAWRWLGPSLAVGVTVIGVSVSGLLSKPAAPPARDTALPIGAVAAPVPSTPIVEPRAEPPVTTVSVNDLAAAPPARPPERTAPSARSVALRGRETISPTSQATDAGAARSASGPTFSEELALVSAARSALEAGDTASCMRAVERYDARFRSGLFAHEIEVIQIEALAAAGEHARADALAARFLAANASSPYAELVRSLVSHPRD